MPMMTSGAAFSGTLNAGIQPNAISFTSVSGTFTGAAANINSNFISSTISGAIFSVLRQPSITSSISLGNNINQFCLWVSGKYAYVGCNNALLYIIDVSNASSPSITSSFALGASPYGLQTRGKYCYVAASNFFAIDVSNPASPALASSIGNAAFGGANGLNGIWVSGKYAYLSGIYDRFQIVDISNASSLQLLASSIGGTVGTSTLLDAPTGVFVSGRYAYVATRFNDALTIIDVSNASTPSITSSIVPFAGARLQNCWVSGKYCYAVGTANKLAVIDISNPASPTLTSTFGVSYPLGLWASGRYLYIGVSSDAIPVSILDISNPNSLSLAGTVTSALSGVGGAIFVSGKYIYFPAAGSIFVIAETTAGDFPNIDTGQIRANTMNITETAQIQELNVGAMNVGYNTQFQGEVSAINFIQSGTYNIIAGSTALGYLASFNKPPFVTLTPVTTSTAAWNYGVNSVSTSSFTVYSDTAGTMAWHALK